MISPSDHFRLLKIQSILNRLSETISDIKKNYPKMEIAPLTSLSLLMDRYITSKFMSPCSGEMDLGEFLCYWLLIKISKKVDLSSLTFNCRTRSRKIPTAQYFIELMKKTYDKDTINNLCSFFDRFFKIDEETMEITQINLGGFIE